MIALHFQLSVATVVGYQMARSRAVSTKVLSHGMRGSVFSTCTSGTPQGATKYIPVSRAMVASTLAGSKAMLAAYAGTMMGLESNAMQYYPEASLPEAAVHPGLYRRRGGVLDLSTLGATGFGYRLAEIQRQLPGPAV